MNLLEEARNSFHLYKGSIQDFQMAVNDMTDPVNVSDPLARKAVVRDRELSFMNYTLWVRNNPDLDVRDIQMME